MCVRGSVASHIHDSIHLPHVFLRTVPSPQRRLATTPLLLPEVLAFLKAEGEPSWLDILQMVHLRLLAEPPIAACPSGRSCSLFELGCAPAFRIQFRCDHPPRQSAYYSVPESSSHRDFSRLERISPQLLGDATEQMSLSLGQTLAGLLNATFGKCGRNHRGSRRAVQRRSPDRADLRMYPTSISPYTCLPCADARFYFIEYSLGFGLLLPCWYVEVSVSRTRALTLTRTTGGIFKHESEFSVTAAQTLVFRLYLRSLCVLI
jgi:hypothetical protein